MTTVLFVCVQNGARSQMAEAFANHLCSGTIRAESAGLQPGILNPLAVAAMREVGIDISANRTKSTFEMFRTGRLFAHVVTVCDDVSAERCPIFPGVCKRAHWNFADPAAFEGTWEERLAQTRVVRDAIRDQVRAWCDDIAPRAALC